MTRDLSVAVDAGDEVGELGDRVRDALGDDATAVEEVSVLSTAPYEGLPPTAVTRMGITDLQKNVLVRVVLRQVERTLTDAEPSELRDRIYAAIHQGGAHEWSVP